jgi:ABC-type lipoprotein export system ATPase subunit
MSSSPPATAPVLHAVGISRSFVVQGARRTVLDHVDLQVHRSEVVAVVGRSGSGKSTLLNVLGLLDHPDEGVLTIAGTDCSRIGTRLAAQVRSRSIGFVFQSMNLIAHLDVLDNILVGAHPAGHVSVDEVVRLLDELGLAAFAHRRAAELSLGEQQRVAVVRALAKRPAVILADEPTGSLDAENERSVMTLLRRAAEGGSAVVVVTHSSEVAAFADRVVRVEDDALVEGEV